MYREYSQMFSIILGPGSHIALFLNFDDFNTTDTPETMSFFYSKMKPLCFTNSKRFRKIVRFERLTTLLSFRGRSSSDDDDEEEEVCVEEKRLLRPYPPLKGGCVSRSLRFSYALVQPPKRPPSSTFLQPLLLKKEDKDEFSLF